MIIEYSSNNSGGYWWLNDEDWKNLEKAGWMVEWRKPFFGARATSAKKDFDSLRDAIIEFEKITSKDASEEGCNCCGPPHEFWTDNDCVSGDEILQILYPGSPQSLREAIEKGQKQ